MDKGKVLSASFCFIAGLLNAGLGVFFALRGNNSGGLLFLPSIGFFVGAAAAAYEA